MHNCCQRDFRFSLPASAITNCEMLEREVANNLPTGLGGMVERLVWRRTYHAARNLQQELAAANE